MGDVSRTRRVEVADGDGLLGDFAMVGVQAGEDERDERGPSPVMLDDGVAPAAVATVGQGRVRELPLAVGVDAAVALARSGNRDGGDAALVVAHDARRCRFVRPLG